MKCKECETMREMVINARADVDDLHDARRLRGMEIISEQRDKIRALWGLFIALRKKHGNYLCPGCGGTDSEDPQHDEECQFWGMPL